MEESTFIGSCLCGSVRYEVTGHPERFYHCHCKRCRKASGTGHASNLLVRPGLIKWTQGEELIGAYKIPEAKRFTSRFCTKCGSQVPRMVSETSFIVIPAGSLDSEAILKPQARIFWDSRVAWSCDGGDIPVYPEYKT